MAVSLEFGVFRLGRRNCLSCIADFAGGFTTLYAEDDDESLINFGFEPFTEELTGQLGVFLPAASDYAIVPDDYIFVFQAEFSTITSVTAIIRTGDVDVWQAIDINFWILTDELGSESAEAGFETIVRTTMDIILNPHQLEVGQISFYGASDAQYDDFAYPEITDEDELAGTHDSKIERLTDVVFKDKKKVPTSLLYYCTKEN